MNRSDKQSPRREPGNGWWITLYVLIGICVFAVIAIALASAWPSFTGMPSYNAGTIWVTAFSAVGTLGAVWAALQAVRISTRNTKRIQEEAQAREETLRHDAIRPILTVEYCWQRGAITLTVMNDGTHAAHGLHFSIKDERLDVPLMPSVRETGYNPQQEFQPQLFVGRALRPYLPDVREASEQLSTPRSDRKHTRYRMFNPTVLNYQFSDGRIPPDKQWFLLCHYEDALGMEWHHEVALLFEALYEATNGKGIWLSLGKPLPGR